MLANIIGMCLSTKHREHCLGFAVFWFNWANSLINTTINLNCSLLCCKVIFQITVHVNRIRTEMMSQKTTTVHVIGKINIDLMMYYRLHNS